MAISITDHAMMTEFRRVYDELMAGDTAQKAIAASMKPLLTAFTAAQANPTDVGFSTHEDLKIYSTGVDVHGANVGLVPNETLPPAKRPWV